MASRGLIVTAVLLYVALELASPASAAGSRRVSSCCTKFTIQPIPFHRIIGYREIAEGENCRFKAIIFLTKLKREICAKPGQKWVKEAMKDLSDRLKKLSKPATDGSGSFSSTTETIPKTTDEYYW